VQIIRFLTVGVLNTLAGLSFIYLAMGWLHVDYRWANAAGFALGCGLSFVLNRSWTFQHQGVWWHSLLRWLGVVAVAYALNLTTVIALREMAGIDAYVAQLGGMVVYTASSFVGGRYFAFMKPAIAG
jgi:putative flippase GtrA